MTTSKEASPETPASMLLPPLPRGRIRFVMPLLLLAPMALISVGTSAWTWLAHGGEDEGVGRAVAQLGPGMSAEWSADTWRPWRSRLGGVVAVVKQEGDGQLLCRDAIYSVGAGAPQVFRVTLCQVSGEGHWVPVRDGASRLGF